MMCKPESVFKILGIVYLLIGALFLILSLVFDLILSSGVELAPDDAAAFNVLIFVFLGIGLVFAVLGLIFFLTWKRKEARAERLKSEGICYDAEIMDIKPSSLVSYGRYGYYRNPSFIVECWYRDKEVTTATKYRNK